MDITRIDIKEFRELGYLQELNRQFLHPLGLALEVMLHEDGTEELGGIWDYRDDPEGVQFGEIDAEKAAYVLRQITDRALPRVKGLGFNVQPVN